MALQKKTKGKSVAKKVGHRQHEEWLAVYREACQARYRLAMEAYEAQDSETQEVLDRIRDRLVAGASGLVRLPDGTVFQVDADLVGAHAMYAAVEILKDLALFDIQVANFQFPKAYCAECGVELRQPRKAVARRGSR